MTYFPSKRLYREDRSDHPKLSRGEDSRGEKVGKGVESNGAEIPVESSLKPSFTSCVPRLFSQLSFTVDYFDNSADSSRFYLRRTSSPHP